MVALRHQHDVIVASHNGLIQSPVGGINALDGEAFGPVDLIKVNLLEVRFQDAASLIDAMDIVLVRRIGAPVSRGGINFYGHEALAGKTWRKNRVNLAGGISAAPNFNGHFLGRDQMWRMLAQSSAPSIGEVQQVAFGLDAKFGFWRQVKSIGHSRKDIGACRPLANFHAMS